MPVARAAIVKTARHPKGKPPNDRAERTSESDHDIGATLRQGIEDGLRDLPLVARLLHRHGEDGLYRLFRATLRYSAEPASGSPRDAKLAYEAAMLLRALVARARTEQG